MGGAFTNDVWRSVDSGVTWTLINGNAGWSRRQSHTSVAMPDGSIILIGGVSDVAYTNDVWRLITASSSIRDPSHTYTEAGTYSVTLKSYSGSGSNLTHKIGYINRIGPSSGRASR